MLATERQDHHAKGFFESPEVADVSLCPKELCSQETDCPETYSFGYLENPKKFGIVPKPKEESHFKASRTTRRLGWAFKLHARVSLS